MKTRGNRGFTLMELLVVVAIVGLLAAVAVPKYGELLEKTNLGATLGNLASLRSAYSIYMATYMQAPKSIDPAYEPQFARVLPGAVPFVKATYPGGSLSPRGNTVTASFTPGAVPPEAGKGWFYNAADGRILINSTETDIKGFPYTIY